MWTFGEQLALELLFEPRKELAHKTYHETPNTEPAPETDSSPTQSAQCAQRNEQCQQDLK